MIKYSIENKNEKQNDKKMMKNLCGSENITTSTGKYNNNILIFKWKKYRTKVAQQNRYKQ